MDSSHSISPQLNQSSPLDSLLRRTSSRRAKAKHPTSPSTSQVGGSDQYSQPSTPQYQEHNQQDYYGHPQQHQQLHQQPASPLLHTQFRASTATTNTTATSMMSHYRGSGAPSMSSWYSQDDSAPPSPGWSQREWDPRAGSFIEAAAAYGVNDVVDANISLRGLGFQTDGQRDTWTSDRTVSSGAGTRPDSTALPRVVVSSDHDEQATEDGSSSPQSASWTAPSPPMNIPYGRAPSRIPTANGNGPAAVNFSRPRFTLPPADPEQDQETVSDLEERKRQVLARHGYGNGGSPSSHSLSTSPSASSISTTGRPPTTSPQISALQNQNRTTPSQSQSQGQGHQKAFMSPTPSLYSNYSFYQLDSQTSLSELASRSESNLPSSVSASKTSVKTSGSTTAVSIIGTRLSPSQSSVQTMGSPGLLSPTSTFPSPSSPSNHSASAIAATTPAGTSTPTQATTPQEYLQLGITHHLANRLPESARCFELSATQSGGCGVGMLMWGLTLRHGWGCEKSEKVGFRWLRRAAECAVEDLEGCRGGVGETGALKVRKQLSRSFLPIVQWTDGHLPSHSLSSFWLSMKSVRVFIVVGGLRRTRKWQLYVFEDQSYYFS